MGDADPVRCARRSLAARLSLAVVFGRDGGGHRTRPVAGIPEARPAARGAERQRRSDDRRRDHKAIKFGTFTVNECILEAPDLHSAMRIFADNYDRSLVQLSPMTDGDNWDCE